MIRPNLRDLINSHKPTMESNNEENDRAESKIQLVMQNNFISDKNFEGTRTIYSASRTPVEMFMGSDTGNTFAILFNTILDRIQQASNEMKEDHMKDQMKHQMKEEADLLMKVLFYCIIILRPRTLEEVNHI